MYVGEVAVTEVCVVVVAAVDGEYYVSLAVCELGSDLLCVGAVDDAGDCSV